MDIELRKFVAPEVIFGSNAIEFTSVYAENFGVKKAFVVSDEGVEKAGWATAVTDVLDKNGINWHIYDRVTPNPKSCEVMQGVDSYLSSECDIIIAVGGGSPMDCAKAIGIVVSNGGHILDYEGVDMVGNPPPPMIFIPTTAGSAADISQFAIITDEKRQLKIPIISKMIVPDVALLAPETTVTMDAELTAATGMDALCHAIEAYVSNAASSVTEVHALKAVELVGKSLFTCVNEPDNIHARNDMLLACFHAGLAFSNASLGAVHAMAHSLGGLLDSPHGVSNAVLLPHVIRANMSAAAEKFKLINLLFIKASGLENKGGLADNLSIYNKMIGIEYTLSDMGVKKCDLKKLSETAFQDACLVTNPVDLQVKDIENIFLKAI